MAVRIVPRKDRILPLPNGPKFMAKKKHGACLPHSPHICRPSKNMVGKFSQNKNNFSFSKGSLRGAFFKVRRPAVRFQGPDLEEVEEIKELIGRQRAQWTTRTGFGLWILLGEDCISDFLQKTNGPAVFWLVVELPTTKIPWRKKMGGDINQTFLSSCVALSKNSPNGKNPQRIPKGLQWKKKLTLDLKKGRLLGDCWGLPVKQLRIPPFLWMYEYLKCLVTWVKKPLYIPI